MRIARPRLLAGSLAVAVLLIVAMAAVLVARNGPDGVDAVLDEPHTVITFPNDGLGNDVLTGDPLPLVELGDRDGNIVSTASFVGRPLVINFWFSTCAPCARELPEFAEVHAEYGDQVRFIGVNPLDSIEVMERFAGERGVQFELYRDELASLTDAIGAASFPITIFVTPEGGIVGQAGVLDADGLRERVERLLERSA